MTVEKHWLVEEAEKQVNIGFYQSYADIKNILFGLYQGGMGAILKDNVSHAEKLETIEELTQGLESALKYALENYNPSSFN